MISGWGGGSLAAGTTTRSSPATGDSACLKSALALPDTAHSEYREARLSPLIQDARPQRRDVHSTVDAVLSTRSDFFVFSVVTKAAVSPSSAALHAQQGPAQ